MGARKETRFNLGPQVKGDSHGILSFKFTPAESLSLMTWVPSLLLFVMQAYLEDGWRWMHDNTSLVLGLFFGSWVWLLILALMALALSAWVKWKPAAGP
jgi:hypothetical protein